MLRRLLISTGLLAMVAGPTACRQPEVTPPPDVDPMAQTIPDDPAVRVRDLRILVDQLAADADNLPGANERVYRARMADALEGLAQSLRLAQGPAMNGAFRVRIYAIQGAAEELRDRPADHPVETSVTGALRAAHSAMADISADRLRGDGEINEQLSQFGQTVRQLDRERGALHRVAASNAYRQGIQAMQSISERFAARIPAPSSEEAPAPEGTQADEPRSDGNTD